ncbi:hypothetical protein FRC01_002925, partial [Tulasnella sp. 417]
VDTGGTMFESFHQSGTSKFRDVLSGQMDQETFYSALRLFWSEWEESGDLRLEPDISELAMKWTRELDQRLSPNAGIAGWSLGNGWHGMVKKLFEAIIGGFYELAQDRQPVAMMLAFKDFFEAEWIRFTTFQQLLTDGLGNS